MRPGSKNVVRVTTSLFWKPFTVRFQDTLEELSFHASLVQEEILTALYRKSEDTQLYKPDEIKAAEDRLRDIEERRDRAENLSAEVREALELQYKGIPEPLLA